MDGIYVVMWVPDEGRPHQELVIVDDRIPLLAEALAAHLAAAAARPRGEAG